MSRMKAVKEHIKTYCLSKVLAYVDSDYEKNAPKVLKWLERFDSEDQCTHIYKLVRGVLSTPGNNWNTFIKSIYADLDAQTRRILLKNFVINASITGNIKRVKTSEKEGCNVPWAILMDPTSACNLKCKGCWASEYGSSLSMTFETLDKIITEGKELGTYMFIYSGGEPLVRKKDIIKLCEKHSDCSFLAFLTAGRIFPDLLRGNLPPVGSIFAFGCQDVYILRI